MSSNRRAAIACVSLLIGAAVFLATSPEVLSVAASRSSQRHAAGDAVTYQDREWIVVEVLDWYALPTYKLADEQGLEIVAACCEVDGTPP